MFRITLVTFSSVDMDMDMGTRVGKDVIRSGAELILFINLMA